MIGLRCLKWIGRKREVNLKFLANDDQKQIFYFDFY